MTKFVQQQNRQHANHVDQTCLPIGQQQFTYVPQGGNQVGGPMANAQSLAVVWREIFWAPAVERSPTVPNPMAFGGFLFVSEGRSSRSRIHQRSTNDHEAPRILDGSWALGLLIALLNAEFSADLTSAC